MLINPVQFSLFGDRADQDFETNETVWTMQSNIDTWSKNRINYAKNDITITTWNKAKGQTLDWTNLGNGEYKMVFDDKRTWTYIRLQTLTGPLQVGKTYAFTFDYKVINRGANTMAWYLNAKNSYMDFRFRPFEDVWQPIRFCRTIVESGSDVSHWTMPSGTSWFKNFRVIEIDNVFTKSIMSTNSGNISYSNATHNSFSYTRGTDGKLLIQIPSAGTWQFSGYLRHAHFSPYNVATMTFGEYSEKVYGLYDSENFNFEFVATEPGTLSISFVNNGRIDFFAVSLAKQEPVDLTNAGILIVGDAGTPVIVRNYQSSVIINETIPTSGILNVHISRLNLRLRDLNTLSVLGNVKSISLTSNLRKYVNGILRIGESISNIDSLVAETAITNLHSDITNSIINKENLPVFF